MPAPTNTLLIEGTFEELAQELAQYIDNLSKNEGEGLAHDVQESLQQEQKDEVLKKIITKAQILNSAPERGNNTMSESDVRLY
jgi:translation initiation factor 3 subunit M